MTGVQTCALPIYRLGAVFGEAAQPALERGQIRFRAVRLVKEQTDFGEIRSDQVRAGDEPAHFRHHLRGHGRDQLAVIPEHGIDHSQAAGSEAIPDAPRRRIHLRRGRHEAGVHAVKAQPEALPVIKDADHVVRQVEQRKIVIAHRLRGQDGCGQGRGLNAHAGQDRDGRRQGRPGEPGEIVDSRHSGNGIAHCF